MKRLMTFVLTALVTFSGLSLLMLGSRAQAPLSTIDQNDDLYYYNNGSGAPTWGAIDMTYSEVSQANSTHIRLLTKTAESIPLTNQWQSFYWLLDTGAPTTYWEVLGGNPDDSNDLTVAYYVAVSWSADGALYVRCSTFWDDSGTVTLIEDARDHPEKYFSGNTCSISIPLSMIGSPSSIKWVAGSSDGKPNGRHDKAPNTGHVALDTWTYEVVPLWMQWYLWTNLLLAVTTVIFAMTTFHYRKKGLTPKESKPTPTKSESGDQKVCSSCGAKLPTDSKFCGECGTSLQ